MKPIHLYIIAITVLWATDHWIAAPVLSIIAILEVMGLIDGP